MITINWPSRVNAELDFFEWLVQVELKINAEWGEEIIFQGKLNWFCAELCAPLGAILHKGLQNLNSYRFNENVSGEVLKIWAKNGFWEQFGGAIMADEYDTTLAFDQFAVTDERNFAAYIQRELMPKELPEMSDVGKHRFANSIQEVFSNAVSHSGSQHGIFTCGQNYPTKGLLSFVITDLGDGIRRNVEKYTGETWKSTDAIQWAVQEGNTTKSGSIPGGLGLTWLLEFIDENDGCLTIVSQEGYWRRIHARTISQELKAPFPGTVVLLDIRTEGKSTF